MTPFGERMRKMRAERGVTLKQMAVDPKHELSVLANLLRTVPTYRLFLSEDRELNPRAVEHAIARAAAA